MSTVAQAAIFTPLYIVAPKTKEGWLDTSNHPSFVLSVAFLAVINRTAKAIESFPRQNIASHQSNIRQI
jgi:hypothetical protein